MSKHVETMAPWKRSSNIEEGSAVLVKLRDP